MCRLRNPVMPASARTSSPGRMGAAGCARRYRLCLALPARNRAVLLAGPTALSEAHPPSPHTSPRVTPKIRLHQRMLSHRRDYWRNPRSRKIYCGWADAIPSRMLEISSSVRGAATGDRNSISGLAFQPGDSVPQQMIPAELSESIELLFPLTPPTRKGSTRVCRLGLTWTASCSR